jgi:hypothetical protein
MTFIRESVRSLEQQESGEIRRLRCSGCDRRNFLTLQQLERHEASCIASAARPTDNLKPS